MNFLTKLEILADIDMDAHHQRLWIKLARWTSPQKTNRYHLTIQSKLSYRLASLHRF